MTCVVNFVFALSQLQGVEWGWPGRREPDDEHSPGFVGGGDSFLFIYFIFYLYWYSYIVYFVCDSASEFGAMGSTFSVPYFGLACDHGNSFLCLEEKDTG